MMYEIGVGRHKGRTGRTRGEVCGLSILGLEIDDANGSRDTHGRVKPKDVGEPPRACIPIFRNTSSARLGSEKWVWEEAVQRTLCARLHHITGRCERCWICLCEWRGRVTLGILNPTPHIDTASSHIPSHHVSRRQGTRA